jgi:hypothetical protein
MKVILDIKDTKADFVMELLKNLSFVKTKPLSPYKAKVLGDIAMAVNEISKVKSGKLKARNVQDLINEL